MIGGKDADDKAIREISRPTSSKEDIGNLYSDCDKDDEASVEETGQAALRRLLKRCIVTVIKMNKPMEKEEAGQAVLRRLLIICSDDDFNIK